MNKPLTNAVVQLTGIDGNAFVIIGRVSAHIKRSDKPELVEQFIDDAQAGDYDNMLQVCMKYVTVE